MIEEFVVVKLVDGDQFIARLLNQTDNGVLVLRPISIKLQPVVSDGGDLVERLVTSVYCPMSDQESFIFDARHVLFVNRLHPQMISQYENLSEDLYTSLKDPGRFSPPKRRDQPKEEHIDEVPKEDKKRYYH